MPHPQRIKATMEVAHSLMIHGALPVHRLLSHGITRHQVAAVVHAGELARIRSGVLIDARRWCAGDAESRLRTAIAAAHAARPGGVAVAQTAAALWRLPMFDSDSRVRVHVAGGLDAWGLDAWGLDAWGPDTWGLDAWGPDTWGPDSASAPARASIFLDHPVPRVHLAVSGDGERSGWLYLHNIEVPESFRCIVDGLPVTTCARTAIDYTMVLRMEQAVAVVDCAARQMTGLLEPERDLRRAVIDSESTSKAILTLAEASHGTNGRNGAGVMRRALELVNPASESVLESISRVNMVRGRLLVPECGQPVRGDDGNIYWCDFLWRHQRVIGEADGLGKYTATDDLRREKIRQEALANAGWTVIRWNWTEGVVRPKEMVTRIRRALHRAAA